MNKKRSLILTISAAILLIGLLVWRLTPRSLESLTGLDFDQAISVSAYTHTWEYHNSESEPLHSVWVRYSLENIPSDQEDFTPILSQFNAINARPSLTNLLRPWLLSDFSWTGNIAFLNGFVLCGDTAANFTLTDRGELTVGRYLYLITDEAQFTALWDYVTTHGTEQKS